MKYTKQDDFTLVETKTVYTPDGSTFETQNLYKKDFLLTQVESIAKQRDEMIDLKQKELDYVSLLLSKCDELGVGDEVVAAPAEPSKDASAEDSLIVNPGKETPVEA